MPLITSRAYPLALSLTEPEGFFVAAGRGVHCQDFAKRIPAYRAGADCSPPVVNDAAPVVTAPAKSGQGVGTIQLFDKPRSNLDLTGLRVVKRGSVVSWYGLRFSVSRVRTGRLIATIDGRLKALPCRSVQVVG